MEALFLTTVFWLAADILFGSFNGSWYFVVGPVLARRRGRISDDAPPPPSPETLERLTSDEISDGDPRFLLFVRRSESVYTFRRRPRRGVAMLQGSVRFDRERGTYEVQSRLGIFFIAFLLSLTCSFT